MDGCASLFRCDKGMCADETSQCFAVAKAVIGISNGICNTSEHKSTFRNPHQYKSKKFCSYKYSVIFASPITSHLKPHEYESLTKEGLPFNDAGYAFCRM